MAGEGYAMMGEGRRSIIKNRQNVDKWRSILGDVSTAATFLGGQMKKSKTAWGEYEKGYEAIGGTDPITKPKFGQKGWLQSSFVGPKGSVMVGDKSYEMENIQKAGQFAGSDTSALLDQTTIDAEVKRRAGGKTIDTTQEFDIGTDVDIQKMDWANMSKSQRKKAATKGYEKKSAWEALQLNNENKVVQ